MPYADREKRNAWERKRYNKQRRQARYWLSHKEKINQRRRSAGEKQIIKAERDRVRALTPGMLEAEIANRTRRNIGYGMDKGRAYLAALSEVKCLGARLPDQT